MSTATCVTQLSCDKSDLFNANEQSYARAIRPRLTTDARKTALFGDLGNIDKNLSTILYVRAFG